MFLVIERLMGLAQGAVKLNESSIVPALSSSTEFVG